MTDTKTLRLKNPGDLLAAVPGLLGFHPWDSAVLMTVGAATHPCHARIDLPVDPDDVDGVAAELVQVARQVGADRVALVVYTHDAEMADLLAVTLDAELTAIGVSVPVAIRADGERWFPLEGWLGSDTGEGTPYDVSTHPITVESVVEGRVVHGSREALRDSLVGTDLDEIEAATDAMEIALARMEAAGRHPLGPENPAALRAYLVQEGRWVQHRIRRFVQDRQRLDTHDLGRLLVAMVRIDVRDVAWTEITREDAQAHVDLWADVVRRSPHAALPAPASLLGFAAWLAGDGALAWCAVDRAHEADPSYSLASLVAQTLACALPPSAWAPMRAEALPLFAG